jgi:hypothetical protein
MSATPQELGSACLLRCAACGRDDDHDRGWRVYLAEGLPAFCPECAERELGEDER